MTDILGLIYAGAVAFGGIMGYVKAGSTISMVAGITFGTAIGYGAYTNNQSILLLTSGALSVLMGTRFYNSGKMMPAGIITILSVVMFIRSASYLLK